MSNPTMHIAAITMRPIRDTQSNAAECSSYQGPKDISYKRRPNLPGGIRP